MTKLTKKYGVTLYTDGAGNYYLCIGACKIDNVIASGTLEACMLARKTFCETSGQVYRG